MHVKLGSLLGKKVRNFKFKQISKFSQNRSLARHCKSANLCHSSYFFNSFNFHLKDSLAKFNSVLSSFVFVV